MLYEKYVRAIEVGDMEAFWALHHDDYQVTWHSSGQVQTKEDLAKSSFGDFLKSLDTEKNGCIYENEDIMVMHNFVTYASGGKDAVMAVFIKKDGLIWKAETGATPIK